MGAGSIQSDAEDTTFSFITTTEINGFLQQSNNHWALDTNRTQNIIMITDKSLQEQHTLNWKKHIYIKTGLFQQNSILYINLNNTRINKNKNTLKLHIKTCTLNGISIATL